MEKVNLKAIKEHVSTQYGDLTGVVQIDGHESITSIYSLCSDYKFDTSGKFIIGFGLGESTINGIGKTDEVRCSIFYIEKDTYGNTYDEIALKIKSGSGKLKLQKKDIYIKYSSLGKYIKRFDLLATTDLTRYATEIEIEDANDDDEE